MLIHYRSCFFFFSKKKKKKASKLKFTLFDDMYTVKYNCSIKFFYEEPDIDITLDEYINRALY